MSTKVAVNDFVRRQVKGSGKTYSPDLTFEEIVHHVEQRMSEGHFRQGYRDGVIIVQASDEMAKHFVCPLVKINNRTKLVAEYVSRREGEEPYIRIRALNGRPVKAGKVEFILYRHDVLAENNEQTTEADWELVSINAVPEGVEELPMKPVTMMRNQLQLQGGTAAQYSSDAWAKAVRFWQHYAPIE